MKLRNKKTGEIISAEFLNNYQTDDGVEFGFRVRGTLDVYSYNSLAELNEEWQDYKEPKKHYSIKEFGRVYGLFDTEISCDSTLSDYREIGNYFETKEEAEKAVEKLKAWKRLKDKGFKFKGWHCFLREIFFEVDKEKFFEINGNTITDKTEADLNLLFGD